MTPNTTAARETYRFGAYEIVGTAGSGGMGVVYRAIDTALGRTVALKVLHDDLRVQPKIVARFQREAEAFATLDHPNIVHIYSVGSIGKIPYIAMEYIEGDPLSEILTDRGALPWQEALDMGAQVAEALACAHQSDIIHRDIKPGNILIDKNGRAFVTDFGIAKIINATTRLTSDGSRLGTPQYMCPERCQNAEITPASDIYSLGVVLFQSISGRLPYEASSSVELIQKIASGRPARLRDFVPEAPDAVERLIAYMIEKDPKDRPRSAEALAIAIRRVRQGKPLDEHADELACALAAFRTSMSPVDGRPSKRDSTTEEVEAPRWRERFKRRWFALSRTTRLGAALGLLLMACGALAALLFSVLAAPRPYDLEYGVDYGVERWEQTLPLASFVAETADVALVRLNLPDFRPARIHWAAGSTTALVQLEGMSGTRRAHQQTLFAVNPDARTALVAIPPTPADYSKGFQCIAGYTDAHGEPGFLVTTEESTIFATVAASSTYRTLADYATASLAIQPGAGHLAMSYTTRGRDDWILVEVSADALDHRVPRSPAGPPVSRVVYSPDGRLLAYVRELGEGRRELRIAEAGKDALASTRLAAGDFYIGAQPFHPKGNALVLSMRREDEAPILQLIDGKNGHWLADLGPGQCGAWHPGGDYIVASAKDRAGSTQLWAVQAASPYARVQLTHLGLGTLPEFALSDDGRYAVTGEPNGPTVVIVSLPSRPF